MKIKKQNTIKSIKTVTVNDIVFISHNKFKYTQNETKLAFRSAVRIRRRAAKKYNCKFNDVSMSLCLKEAYSRIKKEKLILSGILTKENKHNIKNWVNKEFGFNNINTLVRKIDIDKIIPKNIQQNIILNIAKLEQSIRV